MDICPVKGNSAGTPLHRQKTNTMQFNNNKIIGGLFIIAAVALFIPYTALTIIFEYPDILRQDTATILIKFYQGGSTLVGTWFAFALTGLPLIPAYILLGQRLEGQSRWARVATNIGVAGLIVQMVGLLRWTFVVPVLADSFVHATDPATKAAAIMSFKTIHQFGGVVLGEHLGQLFTVAWTVLITASFVKTRMMPRWVNVMGIISAVIYFMAQGELLHTVIPSFPSWDLAGFLGSTLWLVWLIILGVVLVRRKEIAS